MNRPATLWTLLLLTTWMGNSLLFAQERPAEKKTYKLEYRFELGDKVRWEVVHRVDFDTTVNDTTQRASTMSKSIKCWTIVNRGEDGSFKFAHSVDHVDMWREVSGRARVRYNSEEDANPPSGFEQIASTLGRPLSVVEVSSSGEVLKRKDEMQNPAVAHSEEGAHMVVPLPEKPVAIGESWRVPYELTLPLEKGGFKKIKAQESFRLKKVEGMIATISRETQVLTPIRDPALRSQLIQRLGDGEIQFDLKKGVVIRQQIDVDETVIGFRGATSRLRYTSRFTERLVTERVEVARKIESRQLPKPAIPANLARPPKVEPLQ
ncbi:Hypothetical protein PBC10988_7530 [Planctomycetales bacterium 10988]|nr:Hypothetical protein PBC10988_7530 [Planctomycetales bacterium 10988]